MTEPYPALDQMVYISANNWIYNEHALGHGLRNFPDLPVHGTTRELLADWGSSREPVTAWLDRADDTDLGRATAKPSGT